jgi:hypothetical protein
LFVSEGYTWKCAGLVVSALPVIGVIPALFLGLCLDGFGQFIGYAFGVGHAPKKLSGYEFNRINYLNQKDTREFVDHAIMPIG